MPTIPLTADDALHNICAALRCAALSNAALQHCPAALLRRSTLSRTAPLLTRPLASVVPTLPVVHRNNSRAPSQMRLILVWPPSTPFPRRRLRGVVDPNSETTLIFHMMHDDAPAHCGYPRTARWCSRTATSVRLTAETDSQG